MSKDSKPGDGDSSGDEQDETSTPEYYYNKSKIPTYKVILLGEAGSGKTSLFWRYKYGSFNKGTTLQGTDRFKKEFVSDNGEKMQMILWDTAGMERMGSLTFHYYHGAHAVILVFALNDSTTFDSLTTWNDDASRYSSPEVKRFLVATKSDVEKDQVDVPKEKINSFCRNKNISEIYYTSAKTGDGIDEMFQSVMKSLSGSLDKQSQDDVWALAFPAKTKKKKSCSC
ncbi:ras-related Rab-30 isoform X1 [Paramuricea clavata]|uniref:Ras-related Rab-30 isoform X1 n=1 Tax=Paramuricea clavata TaxID=317549 RepID=A0A6S7IUJ0_PARCT|nr:ras-related Rab-30 isoform X1 [Paramuricea clavata]